MISGFGASAISDLWRTFAFPSACPLTGRDPAHPKLPHRRLLGNNSQSLVAVLLKCVEFFWVDTSCFDSIIFVVAFRLDGTMARFRRSLRGTTTGALTSSCSSCSPLFSRGSLLCLPEVCSDLRFQATISMPFRFSLSLFCGTQSVFVSRFGGHSEWRNSSSKTA